MFMPGGTVREKKAAGDAILGLCKSMTSPDPIPIGQYRGFDMELSFDTFSREYKITLIHQLRHTVTLGTDIFDNIQRPDNALGAFEERMAACVEQLENMRVQLENAKAEVQKPFPQEEELKAKSERLNELNAILSSTKNAPVTVCLLLYEGYKIRSDLLECFCRPTARVGNFAVLKEQESVAAFLHKLWVVGDDELRFPHLREAPDILCHALHVAVVETAGGFVVEDNILLCRQCACDGKPLLLSTRQRHGMCLPIAPKLHAPQHFFGSGTLFILG